MKSLAILIDKLGYTQKAKRICEELNQISENINAVLFVAEYGPPPVKTNFPIVELVKVYDFPGTIIATDFFTNQVMNNCLFPVKKYFYVWDLEYLYQPFSFEILNNMYNSKDVELLVRNQSRYNILQNTWKKPHSILEEFNHKQLEALL